MKMVQEKEVSRNFRVTKHIKEQNNVMPADEKKKKLGCVLDSGLQFRMFMSPPGKQSPS